MTALPEPELSDLKDEVANTAAHLIDRYGATPRGIRTVARRALKTRTIRGAAPVTGLRVASAEDLMSDLEEAVVAIGNSRSAMSAVSLGIRLAEAGD